MRTIDDATTLLCATTAEEQMFQGRKIETQMVYACYADVDWIANTNTELRRALKADQTKVWLC